MTAAVSRATLACALATLLVLALAPMDAGAKVLTDAKKQKLASKFIGNFGRYVEWPSAAFPGDGAPYKVCTVGGNPLGDALEKHLASKTARDRSFQIEHLDWGAWDAAGGCNMVFLNAADAAQAKEGVEALSGKPVLTIGEVDGFAQAGGMIGLALADRNVVLHINKSRLEGAALKASARLYRITER